MTPQFLYRKERSTYLEILRCATSAFFKKANEAFKEHMLWISEHLTHIEEKRRNGAYECEIERIRRIDNILDDFDRKLGRL